jgi:hypothetical protein
MASRARLLIYTTVIGLAAFYALHQMQLLPHLLPFLDY